MTHRPASRLADIEPFHVVELFTRAHQLQAEEILSQLPEVIRGSNARISDFNTPIGRQGMTQPGSNGKGVGTNTSTGSPSFDKVLFT